MINYYTAESILDMNNFLNQLSKKLNIHQSVVGLTQSHDGLVVFYDDWKD